LEHAKVHEDLYGTLRESVLTNLQNGVDVLIDIDTQGAARSAILRIRLFQQVLADIFIMPPDVEELRRRLMKRGTETAQQIESRLATAMRENGILAQLPLHYRQRFNRRRSRKSPQHHVC